MKLYTEEQIRMLEINCGDSTLNEVLGCLTPIELPSDEEINEQLPNGLEGNYVSGFYDGVEWVINHIQQ